jgi:hypothetical protein
MLDWLEVSKHMDISLTFSCGGEPIQLTPKAISKDLSDTDEPVFGTHIREAARTVKKLLSR